MDEIEHLGLDGRVEAARRLVEDEEPRIARERHRDDDPLLHAAGQLMRVALEDASRVGDPDLLERLESPPPRVVETEDDKGFLDLGPDLDRRIQRRGRILVDHRDAAGPEPLQVAAGEPGYVDTVDEDAPRGDPPVPRQVAERGVGGGRLAAPRLADEPVRLAGADRKGDPP